MAEVDWNNAPEGAEFYAAELFYKRNASGFLIYYENDWWHDSMFSLQNRKERPDYQLRPQQRPEETRIDNIGRNRTEDDMGHYDEQRESDYVKSGAREQKLAKETAERLAKMTAREAHLKQSAEQNRAPDSLGKYDRRIKGKYKSGTCTVDVYRVLSAFEITEPELQHCIKKLLAAGQRGAKDYSQDLREASFSLGMLIDRLQE